MFCYQCEQTAKSVACTVKGVCGKDDSVAALQDALIYALKGLALVAEKARPEGLVPDDTYPFLAEAVFVTLTNVNFDPEAIKRWIDQTVARRDALKKALLEKQPGLTFPEAPVAFVPADTVGGSRRPGPRTRHQRRSIDRPQHPVAPAHRPLRPQRDRRLRLPRVRARP